MANEDHLHILEQGIEFWNKWRNDNPRIRPELNCSDLSGTHLRYVNFRGANLSGVDLSGADLRCAQLGFASTGGFNEFFRASLADANLSNADLGSADLGGTDLRDADLSGARLTCTIFANANLIGANFGNAHFWHTLLIDVDLTQTIGLNSCNHTAPSAIDYRTLVHSENVPLTFWRGCGLPDRLIEYLPSIIGETLQFYSCFISYSSKDQEFADRLHADLQNNGVRCWFAPHDLEIGGVIQEDIDRQIRLRDKVILILSEASVASAWVTREVKTALEEEKPGRPVLFPVRIDDAVMDTTDQWAHEIKRTRYIGDFTMWKDHDAYKITFERVLHDLRAVR